MTQNEAPNYAEIFREETISRYFVSNGVTNTVIGFQPL